MCKEMATGVSTGTASTDELVAAAASALENALAEQKCVINTWSEEVRRCGAVRCAERQARRSTHGICRGLHLLLRDCSLLVHGGHSISISQSIPDRGG